MDNYYSFNENIDASKMYPFVCEINICDNILYCYSNNNNLCEVNDDLKIIDSSQSFWKTVEYELKIDIEETDIVSLLEKIIDFFRNEYSISPVSFRKSFEHHFYVVKQNESFSLVKLGKENWKIQKAIKQKRHYNELGRKVTIQRFSENLWSDFVIDSDDILSYPSFYKDKYRCVFVNKCIGSVFGVSVSKTKFLSNKIKNKYEIEVEYWSNILSDTETHHFDQYNKDEMYYIISRIKKCLKEHSINYVFPGEKKSDWLRRIYKKH